MKAIGVIPARFASTRFPGKPLTPILGKPLLQWVIERSLKSKKLSKIVVATDDHRIAKIATQSGVEAIMTDPDLPSGSDRVWAAVHNLDYDVILNIQGDEPLIKASVLDQLADAILSDPKVMMATLGRPMTKEALESQNTAKIVLNSNDQAIYFSRFAIPYSRGYEEVTQHVCLKHVGIYAYRKSFLKQFCEYGPTELERAEGLEQLRALFLGATIKVVRTEQDSWGVDTPSDVLSVEEKLKAEQNK